MEKLYRNRIINLFYVKGLSQKEDNFNYTKAVKNMLICEDECIKFAEWLLNNTTTFRNKLGDNKMRYQHQNIFYDSKGIYEYYLKKMESDKNK